MANTAGRSGGKFPPDNLEGAVRWVWDKSREKTWTNTWDRLICRPKAHELGIPGAKSAAAPDRHEFWRVVEEFKKKQSQNLKIEQLFLDRGVQWGWRYDKGLSEIQNGATIKLVDVLSEDEWIASRTDTAAWKNLPKKEKAKLKTRIEELKKELREGTWNSIEIKRETSGAVAKNEDYKQVQTACIKSFQKFGATAKFTKDGNIIRCMSDLATTDWPNDWIEWVLQNAGQIIKGVEIEK